MGKTMGRWYVPISGCVLVWIGLAAAAYGDCELHSPPQRAVLVELFTSEGCNSCPPADRWLSALRTQSAPAEGVVALAFHVDYWNQLGWRDRFSQPAFSERQREIAARQSSRVIYTPQVVVDGQDLRRWSDAGRFAARVSAIRREPAGAAIEGSARLDGKWVRVDGAVRLEERQEAAAVFVALIENGLQTQVGAGENAGRTLRHDRVVRALLGPLRPDAQGAVAIDQALRLEPGWDLSQLDVVVFAQNPMTGRVLQVASGSSCLR